MLYLDLTPKGLAEGFRMNDFLSVFAKLRKTTISFAMFVRMSVRPHGTTRLPL
jgi:hypothetical protein